MRDLEKKANLLEMTEKEKERLTIVEEKRKNTAFQVAFCGHFSAGKSTILNHLLGAEMLPTSPIPTSANIIGIQNGELGLTVVGTNGEEESWEGEIPWQRVREWGMNGGEIASLTISAPLPFLGQESIIYDTPGVDSTDPTHQAVTLEALYTTDFIVYVMDYNHVQSETNLTFLKQLSDEKKPLYLVINQIDKHDEAELSFSHFDQSVRQTFSEWGINILKLSYTSMKNRSHHLNQLDQFDRDMKAMLYHGNELLPYAKQRLLQGFYLSIAARLQEEMEAEMDEIKERVKEEGFALEWLEEREKTAVAYERAQQAKQLLEEEIEADIQKLMKDVTIFPYTTTELARQWLESIQPNFKVGLLFAKKKTEEEQERRLKGLLDEVQDKVKSQLEFHLHQLFKRYDFTLLSNREEVERALDNLTLSLDADFFTKAVQAGPKNREYVYTFTKERTAAVTRELRQKAATVIALLVKGMETHWQVERKELKEKLEQLNEVKKYADELKQTSAAYQSGMVHYRQQADQFQDAGGYERSLKEAMEKEVPAFEQTTFSDIRLPEETVIATDWEQGGTSSRPLFDQQLAEQWTAKLMEALNESRGEERMEIEREELAERTAKFQQQTFTISLFGAFSAGKSSFANALLGKSVLPVSPHPTTATVNLVKQAEEGHPSETAVVHVKTREQLDAEIKAVAEQLDQQLSFDSLAGWKANPKEAQTSWQKTYQAYLTTLHKSIAAEKWELGSSFEVTLDELQPFVANENDACLIEQVTLYFDSPITKQGIVLVDTPGVNSIHGRHTNVAFKQLRDSDAIFYVSYYNHAFSKADQAFLQQMAKVNGDFQNDKLYFILNAADLASSEQELNGVRKHVYDQLVHNGIDEPRLYPLSSKKGLQAKQGNQEQDPLFAVFETAFYEQTISELKRLSFELLREETKRYTMTLAKGLEYATSEEATKTARRQELADRVEQWKDDIQQSQPLQVEQAIKMETSQLFLYLRERIRFVLGDEFQAAVNVTTVVGASKRAQQQALLQALKEWRGEGEHFLQQELRATFVRLELALYRAVDQWLSETVERLRKDFPSFALPAEQKKQELQLELSNRLLDLRLEDYSASFQSLKAFFEGQQVRALKDKLVEDGTVVASDALRNIEEETLVQLESAFAQSLAAAKSAFVEGLNREVERFDALTDPKHQQGLQQEYDRFQSLIQ
ncbi:dynamin family protein [Halalkalibacter oceani]|uniref:dynamin family protein n=1 Tax=Halalkalibacter oceani TaxID=1653776 RepID=UPI0033954BA8